MDADIERRMRKQNQRQQPPKPKPPAFDYDNEILKLPKHWQDELNSAKTAQDRKEILMIIPAYESAKQRNNQASQPKPNQKKTKKKKQRKKPLTILQCLRWKTGAKYDLLAAERIVSHICRRQGSQRNQAIRGCFETTTNMAKACRIRFVTFWLGMVNIRL